MPAIVTPHENKTAIIAFARRVADHIDIGASAPAALRIVAEQLRETGKQSAADIADAAHKIARTLFEGSTKDAWAPTPTSSATTSLASQAPHTTTATTNSARPSAPRPTPSKAIFAPASPPSSTPPQAAAPSLR